MFGYKSKNHRMMRYLLGVVLCFFSVHALSQTTDNYWKNRKPFDGYWQQDVAYNIDATLDDESDQIRGILKLKYTNNSPNELSELYFHLYQNMFDSNSYASKMRNGQRAPSSVTRNGTEVSKLLVDGENVEFSIDNTILKCVLDKPVPSGQSVEIAIGFVTKFGAKHGRMKQYQQYGHKHFNVVHWYPRIAVYDRKFGWTKDQHLGHEFYGDFGSFKVNITLPEHYILDGAGVLTNRNEVLPPDLMEKLDITQFDDKPWNQEPSKIIEESSQTKTWRFEAEYVHDFAWTADPTYRIGYAKANLPSGKIVDCYALASEHHANGWQNAAEYAAKVIELYSRDFGEYAYPKMIVADARDGMEYPMLTLDGGRDPYYRDLLAHEIGHNWFYGMVGNNETYRAALDEGFTQFLTSWCMEHLEGDTIPWDTYKSGKYSVEQKRSTKTAQVYQGFYNSTISRGRSPNLSTHSDKFHSYDYGQVYYKTATMLYNLQYVLGDSLFLAAMQHYFNQWKFCHPYIDDFRSSIIQFTGVDLNWFFDQWLQSEETLDYAITGVQRHGKNGFDIDIARKGEMEMPIGLTVTLKDSTILRYWIPIDDFNKATDATVLPKWMGWNDFNDKYTVHVETESSIKHVKIDETDRLADVYQLDNQVPMPVEITVDNLSYTRPKQLYQIEWHPSLWYNAFDGFKAGVQAKAGYYNRYHQFDVGLWFSTGIGQQTNALPYQRFEDGFNRLQYRVDYSTPFKKLNDDIDFIWHTSFMDGLANNSIGWQLQLSDRKTTVSQTIGGLYRTNRASLNYLIDPNYWVEDQWNNFMDIEVRHVYSANRKNRGSIIAQVRSPFVGADYQYGYLNIDAQNNWSLCKLHWRNRAFIQYGLGDNWAPESQLYAAGANPEMMQENPWIRSAGFIPAGSNTIGTSTGWFQSAGGLNLRGYNNYLLPETDENGNLVFAYRGHSGASLNSELEFDGLVKPFPKLKRYIDLNTYAFADAGVININSPNESLRFSNLRADAGLGVALNVNSWGNWSDLGKTTIRADFPIWMNRPPADQQFFQFRWLIGVDRAF
jgi:hypothetical protein